MDNNLIPDKNLTVDNNQSKKKYFVIGTGLFVAIILIGIVVFISKNNNQIQETQITPTKIIENVNNNQPESQTITPVDSNTQNIDAKLNQLDSESNEIDKSLNDTAVDVMNE